MRLIDANRIVYSWQIDADGQEHDGVTLQSIIDKMPTIKPEPHWIPCSERLPELDDEVLVTDDYDCIRHCVFCKRGETWRGFVTYEEGMTIDAIAWMPLPSPYREEADQ